MDAHPLRLYFLSYISAKVLYLAGCAAGMGWPLLLGGCRSQMFSVVLADRNKARSSPIVSCLHVSHDTYLQRNDMTFTLKKMFCNFAVLRERRES
jgi:hypothetical protein